MNQTICNLCRRAQAQNEQFKSKNGVDVCERCEAVIERFMKEDDELEEK